MRQAKGLYRRGKICWMGHSVNGNISEKPGANKEGSGAVKIV